MFSNLFLAIISFISGIILIATGKWLFNLMINTEKWWVGLFSILGMITLSVLLVMVSYLMLMYVVVAFKQLMNGDW